MGRLSLNPNALNGRAPYEYIRKIWTSAPDRSIINFIINPIHQMPGLSNQSHICKAGISGISAAGIG